jgi:hypothetical protein
LLLLLCGGAAYAGINYFGGGGDEAVAEQGSADEGAGSVVTIGDERQESDGSTGDGEIVAAPTATDEPQATETPLPEPTDEPQVVPVVEEATEAPPTPTDEPTETATPQPPMVRVIVASANLRGGPGVVYRVLGPIFRDDQATVIAKNRDGSWFNIELEDGSRAWLAASVVELLEGGDANDVVEAATVPVAPTRTPVPPTLTPIPRPTQPPPPPDGGGDGGGGDGGGGGSGGGGDGGGGGGGGYTPEAP